MNEITITLTAEETALLAIMAQYWVNELPDDSDRALELSEKLRSMALVWAFSPMERRI